MINLRLKRQLETLDWDFVEHLPGTSKAIHWYPGTFPSDLPCTLIQALSKPDDLIFDPYGGIGTTALEALRLDRKAWLVEGNPVGCLASYVAGGLILIKSQNERNLSILFEMLREIISGCEEAANTAPYEVVDTTIKKEIDSALTKLMSPAPKAMNELFKSEPLWDALSSWIHADTASDFKKISDALEIDRLGFFGRLLGLVMISAVLRPGSSQTQSWGHIADNVWPKEFVKKNAFRLCLLWLRRTENALSRTEVLKISEKSSNAKRFWVSMHSWTSQKKKPKIKPDCSANVLITSPPYAGAIDYTFAQRLSLYFFGFSEDHVKGFSQLETGARRKRFISDSMVAWASELVSSLSQQTEFMAETALISFVLPHKDAGRDIGPKRIEESLHESDWKKLIEIDRSIRQVRARQSWTSIKKETIQIYGR